MKDEEQVSLGLVFIGNVMTDLAKVNTVFGFATVPYYSFNRMNPFSSELP